MGLGLRISNALLRRRRRRFLNQVDSIASIEARHPEFNRMRTLIREAGTDSLEYFGNGYTHEGGLYLQQNPDEFAALCLLLTEHRPIERYLEIGSASGGACLFLYQHVGFGAVYCVDDGNHSRASSQDVHFSRIRNCHRFLGDSHDEEARRFVRERAGTGIDVAFIDGDHSYEGVVQDIRLVTPFCRRGGLVILHDTVACAGVQRAWAELCENPQMCPRAEYIGAERPLGIGVASIL